MPDTLQLRSFAAAPDTTCFTTFYPLPGLGSLPVNAYLVRAARPVLIDANIPALRDAFVDALAEVMPLDELAFIYLTHIDLDHIGAVGKLLELAPRPVVVTTYLGFGKLGLKMTLAPERAFLLNPGQSLSLGDRELVALRPLVFDAPETTALFDTKTGVLFSADSFGALLPSESHYDEARAVPRDTLRAGMLTWATVDAPWLSWVRAEALKEALGRVRDLDPSTILSAHLPPAQGINDVLIANVDDARSAAPFVGPDQAALLRLLGLVEDTPASTTVSTEHPAL